MQNISEKLVVPGIEPPLNVPSTAIISEKMALRALLRLTIAMLAFAVISSLGCIGNIGDNVPKFGIYLASSNELVLSEHHIEAYYKDTHTIELNAEGIEKWNSYLTYTTIPKLTDCLFSQYFVLKIGGDEIYRGQFHSSASSIVYPGIFISDALFKLDERRNTISIGFSYALPAESKQQPEDPRNSPQVLSFFEKANLLK